MRLGRIRPFFSYMRRVWGWIFTISATTPIMYRGRLRSVIRGHSRVLRDRGWRGQEPPELADETSWVPGVEAAGNLHPRGHVEVSAPITGEPPHPLAA